MKAIEDTRLTVISNFPVATYSGMMPGVLAQQYPEEAMQIDLVKFCAAVGARLIQAEVTNIDTGARRIEFAERVATPYDVLSIGVGSKPESLPGMDDEDGGHPPVVAIKPMQTFLARLKQWLLDVKPEGNRPLRVVVAGAGAGGVEISFCLSPFVEKVLPDTELEVTIIGAGEDVLGSSALSRTKKLVRKEFDRQGVQCITGQRITAMTPEAVVLDDGRQIHTDLVILATGARAPAVLNCASLPRDDRGFLLVRPTLQSTGDDHVFVVGDSGTMTEDPAPKAGVYAVRQAPVLWQNMQRLLRGESLQTYSPQRGFLSILNTGNGQAIAEYKFVSVQARWCFKLKDWIDSSFMEKHQDLKPASMQPEPPPEDEPMRCAGCGGKVGGGVLRRAIERLNVAAVDQVPHGLPAADDAAVIQPVSGSDIAATTDFFKAPLDDPYLAGRIAAVHAASDLYACGGSPVAALAMAVLPPGSPRQQEQMLYEALAGATRELDAMNATLAGGHTMEGDALTLGFTMLGNQPQGRVLAKSNLQPGDALILTKPIGTGVLLAAHMRAKCPAGAFNAAVDSMVQSNQQAAGLFEEFQIAACTDVTGFGLAGHLMEMLNASNAAATIQLKDVPTITGAVELASAGFASSLLPANREMEAAMTAAGSVRQQTAYELLFDPQTSGGLLIAVDAAKAASLVERLQQVGYEAARVIGQVQAMGEDADERRLTVV